MRYETVDRNFDPYFLLTNQSQEETSVTYSAADTIRSETANPDLLSRGTRAYFQARTRNRLYDLVMRKFREKQVSEGLTKATLARRMGKRPDALNRIMSKPSNWTVDTLSDLLLAICGEEIEATSQSPLKKPIRNRTAKDNLIDLQKSSVHSSSNAKVAKYVATFNEYRPAL